jgi:4-aminobutyrate aminotransferase-like enzyme
MRSRRLSKIKNQKSKIVLDLLRAYESRNVIFVEPDGTWPIVWERAKGMQVWDADGKRYLDLTGAFGVAAAGHANPSVVQAGQRQMARLLHAMGDVHPHALKAKLARELSRLTFERWTNGDEWGESPPSAVHSPQSNLQPSLIRHSSSTLHHPSSTIPPRRGVARHPPLSGKTIFCNSGFEAVEAALKTAMLATGKPGVVAFVGAYHGLGYGALNATHRRHFRNPFRSQLGEFGHFVPFPYERSGKPLKRLGSSAFADTGLKPGVNERDGLGRKGLDQGAEARELKKLEAAIRALFRGQRIGAVLVEPIQVRGGINIPPRNFLSLLRELCIEYGALLVFDEVYTGFGRTGKWFACEHSATIPDLICLGKALTGGFPLSACVGQADLMDAAWPPSSGEAIHTSTFLGHPVGCAMALAQINEIETRGLVQRSARLGVMLLEALASLGPGFSALALSARGLGLLAGLELRGKDGRPAAEAALTAIKEMLHRGFVLLPEGEHANVISFTPPLTISENQLKAAVAELAEVLTTIQ